MMKQDRSDSWYLQQVLVVLVQAEVAVLQRDALVALEV